MSTLKSVSTICPLFKFVILMKRTYPTAFQLQLNGVSIAVDVTGRRIFVVSFTASNSHVIFLERNLHTTVSRLVSWHRHELSIAARCRQT